MEASGQLSEEAEARKIALEALLGALRVEREKLQEACDDSWTTQHEQQGGSPWPEVMGRYTLPAEIRDGMRRCHVRLAKVTKSIDTFDALVALVEREVEKVSQPSARSDNTQIEDAPASDAAAAAWFAQIRQTISSAGK